MKKLFCQITPLIGGQDGASPVAQVTGFLMRPDNSLVQLGGADSYQFTLFLPFTYDVTVDQLTAEILPALRTAFALPDLQAQVEYLPFV